MGFFSRLLGKEKRPNDDGESLVVSVSPTQKMTLREIEDRLTALEQMFESKGWAFYQDDLLRSLESFRRSGESRDPGGEPDGGPIGYVLWKARNDGRILAVKDGLKYKDSVTIALRSSIVSMRKRAEGKGGGDMT